MKTVLLLVAAVFTTLSCSQSNPLEGIWVEKDTENNQIMIQKEDGKYWLRLYENRYEIMEIDSRPYVHIQKTKIPLTVLEGNSEIQFLRKSYIPLGRSHKGKFVGSWISKDKQTRFAIKLDDNTALTMDIHRDTKKPVRYYPKPTDEGIHFTTDNDTLFFEVRNGMLIDQDGAQYSKITKG